MAMTKRDTILALIRADVAKTGTTTQYAIRLYCENRISRIAFDQARREGMTAYVAERKRQDRLAYFD